MLYVCTILTSVRMPRLSNCCLPRMTVTQNPMKRWGKLNRRVCLARGFTSESRHDIDPIPRILGREAHVRRIRINTPQAFSTSLFHDLHHDFAVRNMAQRTAGRPPAPPALPGPTTTAAVNAVCIVVLIGASIATYAYDRALLPLYGQAATQHHLNKIAWSICTIGTLTPSLPIWPCILAAGVWLCAMPQTTYWVAVYSGHLGDPIWGPVLTHLVVIAPLMFLATAVVKTVQVRVSRKLLGAVLTFFTLYAVESRFRWHIRCTGSGHHPSRLSHGYHEPAGSMASNSGPSNHIRHGYCTSKSFSSSVPVILTHPAVCVPWLYGHRLVDDFIVPACYSRYLGCTGRPYGAKNHSYPCD